MDVNNDRHTHQGPTKSGLGSQIRGRVGKLTKRFRKVPANSGDTVTAHEQAIAGSHEGSARNSSPERDHTALQPY